MLRDVDPETELGKEIRATQAAGKLVDDRVTNLLLKARLQKEDAKNGFILDGYPRSFEQVASLYEICTKLDLNIDAVVYINLPFEEMAKRILGRITCPNCNRIYSKFSEFLKPKVDNLCDDCNVELVGRNDDNEESLKTRYNLFLEQTLPVLDHYRRLGKVIDIESQENPDDTFKLVVSKLEEKLND
jgi:adenylate kinase